MTTKPNDFALCDKPTSGGVNVARFKPAVAASIVICALMLSGCPGPQSSQVVPSDAKATCTVAASDFASWFESGSVTLNGAVTPANSVTFPNQPNCSFYEWSERMFLWVTSPAPPSYGGGTHVFDSPVFYDVSPLDANGDRTLIPHTAGGLRGFGLRAAQVGPDRLPVLFDRSGRFLEVQPPRLSKDGKLLMLSSTNDTVEVERITMGDNKKPMFFDKNNKEIRGARPIGQVESKRVVIVQKFMIDKIPIFLDLFGNVVDVEEGQADGGVLAAQNGSLIYYATMVNDVFAYFLTGVKNGGIVPAATQFPTTQADLNKITAFASGHGKTFTDDTALVIELKTSWVEASAVSDPGSYITMQGTIPTYDKTDPNHWVQNGQQTVKLALVGIHVVGSTAGHPEMIWSTFEHVDNTPNATFAYINTSNQTVTVNQNTAGTWLFCANGSAGPFNEVHMQNPFGTTDIMSVAPFTISPSNTIRWKVWGGASDASPNPLDASTAASNTEIISMNNSVRGMLASGDIRSNYIFVGATWTIGGASPGGSFPNGNEVGTSKLANTTMETYQQGSNTLLSTGSNCFSCHPTNTTNVSHIFGPLKPLF
ncbi:MAG: hypothetical protein WB699_10300 [Bacteroidota bacterium]